MKTPLLFLLSIFCLSAYSFSQTTITGSRMSEVFRESIVHGTEDASLGSPFPAGNLNNPWEITYGPDNYLWITEARGYKVRRMDPATGNNTIVLDLANGASGYLTSTEHSNYNRQFGSGQNPWPQGGMMGLALHPQFMAASNPKNYVYIAYVFEYDGTASDDEGVFFTNKLVRFTYNTSTQKLEDPESLCDSLPGSSDHNSGRMIIAPVGGSYYLFYGQGDMGAGQFTNKQRPNKAQTTASYEGKVLRFNLEPDTDPGTYDRWIPSGTASANNPFNTPTKQSAVYTKGVRNNQGFAYDPVNNILYGSEHGPYSDDEVNIIEAGKNYGHPRVMGYNDGNYNNAKPGSSSSATLNLITSENAEATAIGATNFREAMYSLFPANNGPSGTANTILNIYNSTSGDPGGNLSWKSIAPSGLDIYTSSRIPGWKNSLLLASLKKGKLFRLKLNASGDDVVPTPATASSPQNDTVGVFFSQNRFRDIAISPGGDTIFVAIDRDGETSGPTTGSGANYSECPGCIKRYVFLGYNDNSGASSIPLSIPIDSSASAGCYTTTIKITNDNDNLWVPITGPAGNVVAEIKANNNSLGTVTVSFYKNTGTVREDGSRKLYLDRNFTITPQTQPTTPVSVRFYITYGEFNRLKAATNSLGQPSNVSTISNLGIFKNNDGCGTALATAAAPLATTSKVTHGTWGYVLQANVSSFSSFYFGNVANSTLPTDLLSFTGSLDNKDVKLLWTVSNQVNVSRYIIERSVNGNDFNEISTIAASSTSEYDYAYSDINAADLPSLILYYRLKMIDTDGSFKYSNIITISLPVVTNKIFISPNPSSGEANIVITTAATGKVQWKLVDNSGRVVMKNTVELKPGNNNIPLNTTHIAAGLYYLNVSGAGIDKKIKFQKL